MTSSSSSCEPALQRPNFQIRSCPEVLGGHVLGGTIQPAPGSKGRIGVQGGGQFVGSFFPLVTCIRPSDGRCGFWRRDAAWPGRPRREGAGGDAGPAVVPSPAVPPTGQCWLDAEGRMSPDAQLPTLPVQDQLRGTYVWEPDGQRKVQPKGSCLRNQVCGPDRYGLQPGVNVTAKVVHDHECCPPAKRP